MSAEFDRKVFFGDLNDRGFTPAEFRHYERSR